MSLIGFARVSTQQQDLTAQLEKLTAYGCVKIFQGKHSGKAETNKQALAELLAYAREGDTVVVTKLDRLGRSLSQVLVTLDELKAKGINLVAIDTSKDDAMSTAMVQLLGVFAEMERNFIVSRTTEGKALSGNYGGRPPKLTKEQRKEIKTKLKQGVSKVALSKEYKVSRATILNIETENE
ncbi:recombinase family protein [Photobacterium damselae subsp. piscicida]|uniref:recombinase family protein n=1 Tax=Photobacterium damselae TaxID=38293 RepID=UPI0002F25AB8|nr:recombinase family protein [Photobacterium damselae]OLQ80938.1 resolvase [Photobacterium damselae subsp. piscicida]TFZ62469.1 recombinase family protein [Photobacterium damselae subsp. piscicida]TJZ85706.1 recombinase family protein [Photobacterium damselae subsp. piscicida]BBC40711.1 DNA-invertase hin [Photobacterium damselae subsp. piscicida]